ncbi:uncharacterized protein LOC143449139 isoform X2 [Clavelina lepadiformis]|uniref:uncharacterized protein LOC143449139 isoform X2 n=1 Tax=Clavelina lepadiformis TaxID=159417 RepID=UPI0040425DDB
MCSTIALFLILMWQTYFIQQSFAGCEDNTCAPNSTCIKIPSKANSTGKMISTQGSTGDGGKHCYGYCMPTSVGLDGSSLTFNGTYDGDLAFSNEMCVYGYPVALATCATTRSNNVVTR